MVYSIRVICLQDDLTLAEGWRTRPACRCSGWNVLWCTCQAWSPSSQKFS